MMEKDMKLQNIAQHQIVNSTYLNISYSVLASIIKSKFSKNIGSEKNKCCQPKNFQEILDSFSENFGM